MSLSRSDGGECEVSEGRIGGGARGGGGEEKGRGRGRATGPQEALVRAGDRGFNEANLAVNSRLAPAGCLSAPRRSDRLQRPSGGARAGRTQDINDRRDIWKSLEKLLLNVTKLKPTSYGLHNTHRKEEEEKKKTGIKILSFV